jgi:hypothetical protein
VQGPGGDEGEKCHINPGTRYPCGVLREILLMNGRKTPEKAWPLFPVLNRSVRSGIMADAATLSGWESMAGCHPFSDNPGNYQKLSFFTCVPSRIPAQERTETVERSWGIKTLSARAKPDTPSGPDRYSRGTLRSGETLPCYDPVVLSRIQSASPRIFWFSNTTIPSYVMSRIRW